MFLQSSPTHPESNVWFTSAHRGRPRERRLDLRVMEDDLTVHAHTQLPPLNLRADRPAPQRRIFASRPHGAYYPPLRQAQRAPDAGRCPGTRPEAHRLRAGRCRARAGGSPRRHAPAEPHLAVIGMRLTSATACALFGRVTVNTPLRNTALTRSTSTSAGSSIWRSNRP